MKRNTAIILIIVSLSMILTACSAGRSESADPSSEQPISSEMPTEPTTSDDLAPSASPSGQPLPTYPMYLPRPYYRTFVPFTPETDDHFDAWLYDFVVDYIYGFSGDYNGNDYEKSTLSLFSLHIIDEWTDPWADFSWKNWDFDWNSTLYDTYSEYYLLELRESVYFDFQEHFLRNPEKPYNESDRYYHLISESTIYIRVAVNYDDWQSKYRTRQAVEVLRPVWYGDGIYAYEEMCEGRPETYNMLMNAFNEGDEITYVRDVLALTPEDLLSTYLAHYFPQ